MDFKKKKANQGSEMVCSSRANSSGYAVTPWGRSSLLPHTGQWTRGFPPRRCAVHSLSIPSLHTSHRHRVLLLRCLTGCWSHCRSEEDLPPSFTKSLLEQKGGKRGQKIFTTCFWQATLVSWAVGWGAQVPARCSQLLACTRLLSCTSGTTRWRLKFKRSFHLVGRYQVGRVVWTGETEGAALDFGQNSRIVLRGQHRGTAVGTLFSLTARVGFVFCFWFFFAFAFSF